MTRHLHLLRLREIDADVGHVALLASAFCTGFSIPLARIFLVIALVCAIRDVCLGRLRLRWTAPVAGWAAYSLLAVVVTAIVAATLPEGSLIKPARGLCKTEKLLWFVGALLIPAYATTRERFRGLLAAFVAGSALYAAAILVGHPIGAWLQCTIPYPKRPPDPGTASAWLLSVTDALGLTQTIRDWAATPWRPRTYAQALGKLGGMGQAQRLMAATIAALGLNLARGGRGLSAPLHEGGCRGAAGGGGSRGGRGLSPPLHEGGCRGAAGGCFSRGGRGLSAPLREGGCRGAAGGCFSRGERNLSAPLHEGGCRGAAGGCFSRGGRGERGEGGATPHLRRSPFTGLRVNWLGVAALLFAGLAITLKRGSLIVLVLVAGAMLARRIGWRRIAAVAALALAVALALPPLRHRLAELPDELRFTKGGRVLMWTDLAPAMHRRHPWGVGFRGLTYESLRYATENGWRLEKHQNHLHSNLVEVAVELGWLGLAAYLAWMALAFRAAAIRREPSDPLSAIPLLLLLSLFLNGLVEYNLVDGETVLIYGLAMGLSSTKHTR